MAAQGSRDKAPLHVRVVSPEYCTYDGYAAYVVVPSPEGEFGILSKRANVICAIDGGYVRICDERMGETSRVIAVGEGYVHVANDEVIILAERSRDMATVDKEATRASLAAFEEELGNLSEDDARRSYLYNEAAWCRHLLAR